MHISTLSLIFVLFFFGSMCLAIMKFSGSLNLTRSSDIKEKIEDVKQYIIYALIRFIILTGIAVLVFILIETPAMQSNTYISIGKTDLKDSIESILFFYFVISGAFIISILTVSFFTIIRLKVKLKGIQ